MDDVIRAAILGVVEGATEFVPVSSTGHLIIVGHLIGFTGNRAALFDIVIQLGAILAVVWNYRAVLIRWVRDAIVRQDGTFAARRLWLDLLVAFLPAALAGLVLHRWITAHLFRPDVVAFALIGGGVVILVVERIRPTPRSESVTTIGWRTALGIGLAQVLSLIPGVSRAAATIIGGVALRVARPTATEFSFLLAIPVMFAATGLATVESVSLLSGADLIGFGVGFLTAFFSALVAIRWLLHFTARHTFVGFAWYRIFLGGLLLAIYGVPGRL